MDRDTKKRARDEPQERAAVACAQAEAELSKKKGKGTEAAPELAPDHSRSVRVDIVDVTDVFRPPGLFEFPWQKGGRLQLVPEPEPDGWDLRHVFFSSLVDGCSAAIGVPGDRLSPAVPGPFCLPEEPSDDIGELDAAGVDCAWSSVLLQPLPAVYSKDCNA